ncbi:MAG: isochorismatase, partial [Thermodesulfobacteriota bacterium]
MPPAILITECLQNDFVKPLSAGEPLPNLLHVGSEEARRLMGENPAEGPVARVMDWAYRQPADNLTIIHLRDWHNTEEAKDKAHLAHFGTHCLAGTEGAAFAFAEPPGSAGRAVVIDTMTLNDFEGTPLKKTLDPLAGEDVPVGLMGVWTEAKVLFLSYELTTRYPLARLGVCSALTAGSSRSRHFLALEQLESILDVRLFASVGEFLGFLGGTEPDLPESTFTAGHPEMVWEKGAGPEETEKKLLGYLFRDCRRVSFQPLGGGFSGSKVFLARSTDLFGHEQVPHVVKIGPQGQIGQERTAFERIETVLGNSAPRIADFADLGGRGALKYRYASMGGFESTTFQKVYLSGRPFQEIQAILDVVFKEQLGRLYRAAVRESRNLLEYYDFQPRYAAGVAARIEALLGSGGRGGGRPSPRPAPGP